MANCSGTDTNHVNTEDSLKQHRNRYDGHGLRSKFSAFVTLSCFIWFSSIEKIF